jgi:chromosome segregation ATPase
MKNKINPVWLLIVLFAIVFFYQYKWQQYSAKKLRSEILGEWEERKKIEDSVKREMESKRRNREFIMQADYQGQLEDMLASKLGGVEEEIAGLKSNLESLIDSRLSAIQESMDGLSRQSGAQIEKMQAYLDRQRQRLDELEISFKQSLKLSQENQQEYLAQIKSLKQEIQRLRKQQLGLEKQLGQQNAEIKHLSGSPSVNP